MDFEIKIIEFLQAGRTPFFDFMFDLISNFGSVMGVIFLCIFFLMYKARYIFWFGLSYGFVNVIVNILKEVVARVRPYNVAETIVSIGDVVEDFSFPSGHVACATAIAIFLGYYIFKRQKTTAMKVLTVVCCSLYVVLVGISRMYLGKHYLTDLLGGFSISAIICICGIILMNCYHKSKNNKQKAKA